MKRKFAIFNLALMAVVLLTTAYQSFHAFSHKHFEQLAHHTEIKKEGKQLLAANEHDDDDCSVCHFHFDFFVAPTPFCLKLDFPFKPIPYSYSSIEGQPSFAGSLFGLRAPPVAV
jgi:hypothetical protein